ncbi:copper homeostasis membrane protein CopD [Xenorhabdus budapestensis]|uniref:Copper resistance protein D n=1 Tax=Xenorhabdus budapestensis TaxID=290110 RepID=A0A2D0J413_XENBU|nr:copper homeostasis membrane protein CopD [Xenorhabdus budapestensis]PHM29170.1 copper resistance protein CopD [Xenorhabdus budapestensis]QTL41393.1 copper homeostasis membrane protein CopD [Xenorhabdus budapestensis]
MISLEALYVLCRFLHFVVVMLMFGFSLFTTILASGHFLVLIKKRLRVGLAISTVLAFITSMIWFIVQAGLMGDGWHDVYQLEIWQAVLTTSFGKVWQWQLLVAALAVGGIFFLRTNVGDSKTKNFLLLGCSVVLLSSHAFIGHVTMYEGKLGLLLQVNQIVHLLSAGYWFGGLWPFLLCLQFLRLKDISKPNSAFHQIDSCNMENSLYDESVVAMRRFSDYGHVAVFLVIVTGIVSSAILIPGWLTFDAPASEYQSMLWLKIILVTAMVLLALINRYILVPKLKQKGRYELLMMNSWLEIILGTAALLCVAIFATESPV